MLEINCFKAYDIRGKLGLELNEKIAYRIGRAFGQHYNANKVVIGRDIRLSSEDLKNAFSKGLVDSGANVIDLGITGTEEVYFSTWDLNADGGIEITASHNPIDYNGIKMVGKGATPISSKTGLTAIKNLAEKNEFSIPEKQGIITHTSNLKNYISHILSYIDMNDISPMKIVLNSGNGSAVHVVDAIEKVFNDNSVPIDIIKIHHKYDGTFPNGIPNPLLKDNRQDTIDAIQKHKADLGVAWDGDFDRCFLFDENANFIEGYYIVGLLAKSFFQNNENAKIVHDPRLIWNTINIIEKLNGTAIQSPSGHSFMKETMRKHNADYGGEMSAHHYFKNFAYCDSGMIPWLLILGLLSKQRTSLSKLVNNMIQDFPSSGEINIVLKEPDTAINHIKKLYLEKSSSVDYMDGISMTFDDWRFNLRKSNTESVVRLNVESRGDIKLMSEKTTELLKILENLN
ncbi:MAG: phosphomannomutase CpsG [Legionellales bacterium]|nr:phosphomannomutase CpsG [Legionellales bacterium]